MWGFNQTLVVVLTLAVVAAAIRPFVKARPLSWAGTYQALAHLLVGGLAGAYVADPVANSALGAIALLLTLVEVLCFVLARCL